MKSLFKKTPRQILNENVVESFKKFIAKTPNSVLFWNGLAYLLFFAVWIVGGNDWAGLISGLGSLLYLGLVFDGNDSDTDLHLWPPLTFLFWIFIGIILVLGLLYLIYIYTLAPFNMWLDGLKMKKKEDKDGSN